MQCVARFACVTQFMPTEDNVKREAFVRDFDLFRRDRSQSASSQDDPPQGDYHHGDMFFLCLVSLVKWPSLTCEALSQLRASGLDPRAATPDDWRGFMVRLLCLVDGKAVADELKGISPGRSAAMSGLIWIAKRWGIIRKVDGDQDPAKGVAGFVLGCMQKRYQLLPEHFSTALLREAMDMVGEASLVFPASSQVSADVSASSQVSADELQRFIEQVGGLCRRLCGQQSKYAAGTLARRVLSVVELRSGPAIWDACSMRSLAELLPDLSQHTVMMQHWTGRDVRLRFAMSPLQVSAMACLWGQVPEALRVQALKADYVDVFRAAAKGSNEHAQPKDWVPFLA